jgi:hypothetical protein
VGALLAADGSIGSTAQQYVGAASRAHAVLLWRRFRVHGSGLLSLEP